MVDVGRPRLLAATLVAAGLALVTASAHAVSPAAVAFALAAMAAVAGLAAP